jgi:molybdopterin molybdotransferase
MSREYRKKMKDVTYAQAVDLIIEHTPTGKKEIVNLNEPGSLIGRILALDIKADRDLPPFNRSAMDGYAIRTKDYKKHQVFTVIGTLTAGSPDQFSHPDEGGNYPGISGKGPFALRIMTGAPAPLWADAVIRFEDSVAEGDDSNVRFTREKAESFMNLAKKAEDARLGDVLIPAGSVVDGSMIPLLAAVGAYEIEVYAKPRIKLVTTGTEVISVEESPLAHQIRDSSSYGIRFLAAQRGIKIDSVKVADHTETIRHTFEDALAVSDILLITGGVSKGITDVIPDILKSIGVEEIFHRAKIKPGKPIFFGKKVTNDGTKIILGLPGNPVSSLVNYKIFVEEAIGKFMGHPRRVPLRLPLHTDKKKKHDLQEFTQCKVKIKNGVSTIEPLSHHGSGDFVNMAFSNGLMIHPADETILSEGTYADFYFW